MKDLGNAESVSRVKGRNAVDVEQDLAAGITIDGQTQLGARGSGILRYDNAVR